MDLCHCHVSGDYWLLCGATLNALDTFPWLQYFRFSVLLLSFGAGVGHLLM